VGIDLNDNFGLELSYREGGFSEKKGSYQSDAFVGKLSYSAYILDAYYYFKPYAENQRIFAFAGVGEYKGTAKLAIDGEAEKESKSKVAPRLGLGVKGTFGNFIVKPSIEYTALNIKLDGEEFINGIYELNLGVGVEF
jgi:hypothetical protein